MKFLAEIKGLKRKNRAIFTPEDIILIEEFENLGENHMERKSITRLGKLFDRAVLVLIGELQESANVKGYFTLSSFRTNSFISFTMKSFIDEKYEYYTFRHKERTHDDQIKISGLLRLGALLDEIADRYFHVSDKQWMQNGKIPKTLQKTYTIKEIIKGKLSEKFQPMATDLAKAIEEQQREMWERALNSDGIYIGVIHDGAKNRLLDSKIQENIDFQVTGTVNAFINRIVDKLGGFEPKSPVKEVSYKIRNEKRFEINVTLENGDNFRMIGKVVTNFSPLGTPYNQFPITFHDMMIGGEIVPVGEANLKKFL